MKMKKVKNKTKVIARLLRRELALKKLAKAAANVR